MFTNFKRFTPGYYIEEDSAGKIRNMILIFRRGGKLYYKYKWYLGTWGMREGVHRFSKFLGDFMQASDWKNTRIKAKDVDAMRLILEVKK